MRNFKSWDWRTEDGIWDWQRMQEDWRRQGLDRPRVLVCSRKPELSRLFEILGGIRNPLGETDNETL